MGELRSLLGNYHDAARVVLVSGLVTSDVDHVQVAPPFMAERVASLWKAIEIHAGPDLDSERTS